MGTVLLAFLALGVSVPLLAQGGMGDARGEILAFIDSAAELLGRGLAWLIGLVLPGTVDPGLVKPLGYLGLLTLLLLVFGLLEAARKLIWLVVGIGWVLMLARILLEAFHGD